MIMKARKAPQLLSLPDRTHMLRDYGNGVRMQELVQRYGITAGYIYVLAQNAGVRRPDKLSRLARDDARRKDNNPVSEEVRAAIIKDYQDGMTNAQIGIKHNVSAGYASHLVKNLGLPSKSGGAWRKELPNRAPAKYSKPPKDPPEPPAPIRQVSAVEVRRLYSMGVGRTKIAAMLRCPYRAIEEALT